MFGTWPYTKLAPAGAFCPKINTLRYNVACQRVVRWPMRDNHFLLDPSQYLLLFPSYSRWSAGDRFFFWKSSPGPTVGLRLSLTTQRFLIAFWLLYNNIFSHSPSGLLCAFWLLLQSESHHCLNSDQMTSKPCTVYPNEMIRIGWLKRKKSYFWSIWQQSRDWESLSQVSWAWQCPQIVWQ